MKWLAASMCLMLTGCHANSPIHPRDTTGAFGYGYKYEIVWETDDARTRFHTDEYVFRGPNSVEFIDKDTGLRTRIVASDMAIYSRVAEAGE